MKFSRFEEGTQWVQKHWKTLNPQKAKRKVGLWEPNPHDQPQQPEPEHEIQSKGLQVNSWNFWVSGLVVIWAWLLLRNASQMVYLIVTAFIVSMAVESLITYFQKRFSRWFSIATTYVLLIIFILSGIILIIPLVVSQVVWLVELLIGKLDLWQSMIQDQGLASLITETSLPQTFKDQLVQYLTEQDLGIALQQNLSENIWQIVTIGTSTIGDASSFVVSVVTGVFTTFVQTSIIVVLAVFFSLEKRNVITCVASFSKKSEKLERVLLRLYTKLGSWLKWQLILCFSIGIMAWLGLMGLSWIFGISLPNKFSLALMAGLTEFIPYVWPFMGMVPALLIGTTEYGFWGFVAILSLYTLIQQLEWNILVPMVMYHTLGVSPLLIFLCMILWWSLFGFLWVLLAVPIAVIVNILYASYSTTSVEPHIP